MITIDEEGISIKIYWFCQDIFILKGKLFAKEEIVIPNNTL